MSAGKDVFGDEPPPDRRGRSSTRAGCPPRARARPRTGCGLPAGFRAAGVACGIKPSGNRDLGLLVCDAENPVSAARFTASGTPAAPVLVSRERCRLDSLRVILANSGCANAATGKRGLEDAAKTQGAAAIAAGVDESAVALASTGGISQYLPVDAMLRGSSPRAASCAARATPTSSRRSRRPTRSRSAPPGGRAVRRPRAPERAVQGRGDDLAALRDDVCFVQTDAVLERATADLLLGVTVKRSFDRASVDGQLSTNDIAILMCSGASGVKVAPESEDELRFGEALDALLRQLAIMMVADGEGAARIARVLVRGGHLEGAEAVARAVANSPLVKAALHSGDPNWGRIVQAVGAAMPGTAPWRSTSRWRASTCARRAPRSTTTKSIWRRR